MPENICVICNGEVSVERQFAVRSRRSEAEKADPVLTCSAKCQAKKNLREYRAAQRAKVKK